ncbi:MAG TPA: VOC family protein [Candidatus Polarisedimenticolaceae bacterium]|nr:VOC family protein [Candidatus Polarisedimenticolaceae bacterium]
MQKITPCLWFENNAEEAMNYYVGVFKNSKILHIDYYPDESLNEHFKGMSGKVINGEFELDGQQFICLDGGPLFKFNEAISLTIDCEDQAEVDYYWEKLSAVPESEQCGWCKDKFGLSWQIIPKRLNELLRDPDKAKASRAMQAMMEMHKLDVAGLEAAFEGKKA